MKGHYLLMNSTKIIVYKCNISQLYKDTGFLNMTDISRDMCEIFLRKKKHVFMSHTKIQCIKMH